MIAQVLNREFMLQQLEATQKQLQRDVTQNREGGNDGANLARTDYQEALNQVAQSLEKEKTESTGQPGFVPPPPTRRGGEVSAPLDDFSFLSRDPVISTVQSALEFYFEHPESRDKAVRQDMPDDRRRGTSDVPVVTDKSLPGVTTRRSTGRRLLDSFSVTDPGWVSSLVAMGVRKWRKRHDFNPVPPHPVQIAERARLILVGDWGSGIPRAQRVATAMRMSVEEGLRDNRETHVVHLGDVYYAGWDYEYQKRFLPYWPVKPEEAGKVGSWCLNGNHDMYSGGHAYFDTLLADPRFQKQERASFFRLYNQHWQFLALDTAWDDNGLKDPQGDWVQQTLNANQQKTILLSHHQLFSAYEDAPDVGNVLREKLGSVLDQKRIYGWFWGHEHRFLIYAPFGNVQNPRLVGHGGVPVYMTHQQSDPYLNPATFEDRRFIGKGLEHWAMFGFAVLDLDGAAISARYVDEAGATIKSEIL